MSESLQPSRRDIYGEGWAAAALGAAPQPPLPDDQALLGALGPPPPSEGRRSPQSASQPCDTGCPHVCQCTSDDECPHECPCQEEQP